MVVAEAMVGMEKSTKLFIVQALGAIAICLSLTCLILVYLWMDDYLGTDQHMDPHKYTSQTMLLAHTVSFVLTAAPCALPCSPQRDAVM